MDSADRSSLFSGESDAGKSMFIWLCMTLILSVQEKEMQTRMNDSPPNLEQYQQVRISICTCTADGNTNRVNDDSNWTEKANNTEVDYKTITGVKWRHVHITNIKITYTDFGNRWQLGFQHTVWFVTKLLQCYNWTCYRYIQLKVAKDWKRVTLGHCKPNQDQEECSASWLGDGASGFWEASGHQQQQWWCQGNCEAIPDIFGWKREQWLQCEGSSKHAWQWCMSLVL